MKFPGKQKQKGQGQEPEREEKQDSMVQIINDTLQEFIANQATMRMIVNLQVKGYPEELKEKILSMAKEHFCSQYRLSGEELEEALYRFGKYLWGYHVLEPLINDPDISDIKCYNEHNVRIKKKGERMDSGITFASKKDYNAFVQLAAVKNQVNLSNINAIQTFTDNKTNPDFIMRFNITTGFVNTSGDPCIHIRKIPKHKTSINKLVKLGYMTEEQRQFFLYHLNHSSGFLFTGKGASGKTTGMNALLDCYDPGLSGLVIQENDELFSDVQEDFLFQHIVSNHGEGKVAYTLADEARNGLLIDLDVFVIGEIKGKEAADFAMASYTGHMVMASVHGKNAQEAINKLADYVHLATGYSMAESLKMCSGIEYVVFCRKFKVAEIARIAGWDDEKQILKIELVTDFSLPEGGEKEVMELERKLERVKKKKADSMEENVNMKGKGVRTA